MIDFLKKDQWSPYLVGFLIGILLIFLVLVRHTIGVSGSVARLGAILASLFAHEHAMKIPSIKESLSDPTIFNWQIVFLIGLFFGAFIAAEISKNPNRKRNTVWIHSFGHSKIKRNSAAFFGGTLLLLGARFANGCTSGHAISGGAQLSITSWVFMITLFATAIPTSFLLYHRRK